LSAEEVYRRLVEGGLELTLSTVYANLHGLSACGFLRTLHLPDREMRFERRRTLHHHLLCRRCGRLEDLVLPPNVEAHLCGLASGWEIETPQLVLTGLCPACQATQSPTTHKRIPGGT
jgi:Fe2+ or Zn2+ uptake regulation protein